MVFNGNDNRSNEQQLRAGKERFILPEIQLQGRKEEICELEDLNQLCCHERVKRRIWIAFPRNNIAYNTFFCSLIVLIAVIELPENLDWEINES